MLDFDCYAVVQTGLSLFYRLEGILPNSLVNSGTRRFLLGFFLKGVVEHLLVEEQEWFSWVSLFDRLASLGDRIHAPFLPPLLISRPSHTLNLFWLRPPPPSLFLLLPLFFALSSFAT